MDTQAIAHNVATSGINLQPQPKINVIEGRSEYFGNITVLLHSLGSSAYRLEWFSRMTGASTSLSRLSQNKYLVMKKWSIQKKLPDISCDFDSRKSALIHFINNVDIINTDPETIYDAKEWCLNTFTEIEKIAPIQSPTFPKLRLQGAIGRAVEVKNRSCKQVIAEGTLLQLIGTKAEVQINKRFYLTKKKNIQMFPVDRVFIQ
ncbi:hypothetical protein tinsulaeT_23720 [Thalassotalea insulae]|uniref:Uncharacterized protein n=1 Tax=Thalassotalea insulae TaxID=2056778 RepID=A0ABQ6GSY8_9GAMM|nr:hypothetical protein [Thalassotalea insulae]GLX79032.1 hypothetical protein tinsulaeT_23720 [Thalassotalea insulae]